MKQPQNKPFVVVLTNIVPDYRVPIFTALQANGHLKLQILVTDAVEHSSGRARSSLPIRGSRAWHWPLQRRHPQSGALQLERVPVPVGLPWDLLKLRPDVILCGDWGLRSVIALVMARLLGARFVIWTEEITASATGRSELQKRIRRFLARHAHGFLAWGDPAAQYVVGLGVAPGGIHVCPQAADNDFWIRESRRLDKALIRQQLGLSGRVALCVARLIQLKGVAEFLAAWALMPQEASSVATAVIVGDGEERARLEHLVHESGIRNVRFVGAKSGSALAAYYAAADFLVLPSLQEIWGMTTNEALCFGLPVLASRFAGSARGLVVPFDVGMEIDPTATAEFALTLESWCLGPSYCPPERCLEAVKNMGYGQCAQVMEVALGAVPG
jgi:glycosyltransferase involved in cell wall biosynthesis